MSVVERVVAPASIIVSAGEGKVLNAFGDSIQVKISGAQTGGNFAVLLGTVPPGGGPPPHIHYNEDELVLVLEGRLRFLVNEQWSETVGADTVIYLPRGVRHTFQNVGETPGRLWVVTMPDGFEQYFTRCAEVFAQPGPPDGQRLLEISAEHGIEFVPPLIGPPAQA